VTEWEPYRSWGFDSSLEGWRAESNTAKAPVSLGGKATFTYDSARGGLQSGKLVIGQGPGGSLDPVDQLVFGRFAIRVRFGYTGARPAKMGFGCLSNKVIEAGNGPYVKLSSADMLFPTAYGETAVTIGETATEYEVVFIYDSQNEWMEQIVVSGAGETPWAFGYPSDLVPWFSSDQWGDNGIADYGVGKIYFEFEGLASGSVYVDSVSIERDPDSTVPGPAPKIYTNGTAGALDGDLEVFGDQTGIRLTAPGSVARFFIRCTPGYKNAAAFDLVAPVDCEVSIDGIVYDQRATFPAGSVRDRNMTCHIRRISTSIKAPTWVGLVTSPYLTTVKTIEY